MPIRWEDTSSYLGEPGAVTSPVHSEWHHALGEIVPAVLDTGLSLTRLQEGDRLEWAFAPWMVTGEDGSYRFPARQRRLVPTEFTLEAVRA